MILNLSAGGKPGDHLLTRAFRVNDVLMVTASMVSGALTVGLALCAVFKFRTACPCVSLQFLPRPFKPAVPRRA
jgi:flagellar biosynthesis protein FliQ